MFEITEKLDKYIPRDILVCFPLGHLKNEEFQFARSMHYVKCFFPHWTPYLLRSSVKRAKALKVKFVKKMMGKKPKLKSKPNDVAPQKEPVKVKEEPKEPPETLAAQSNDWTPTDLVRFGFF